MYTVEMTTRHGTYQVQFPTLEAAQDYCEILEHDPEVLRYQVLHREERDVG